MDVLRELIQTIIVIVVLAVLVEMLLPGGDMRRYVKMVMGLLIIMAVMQAAAGVIHSELMRDVPGVTVSDTGAPPLEDIMAAGQELADTNQDRAAQTYSEGLSRQVMSLAGMNPDVRVVDARVSVGGENGDISEITIVFDVAAEGLTEVDSQNTNNSAGDLGVRPVVVDLGEKDAADEVSRATPTAGQEKAAAKVTAIVAEFYNLQPGQVKCEFRE
ncbi:stage III sporulation protein AF [Desulfoscipio gibsoniae]